MTSEFREDIRNLDSMFLREIDEIDICEFHPLPNGGGKPTQVHMVVTVRDFPGQMVMRFKGPQTLDEVIDALTKHRERVFGKRRR